MDLKSFLREHGSDHCTRPLYTEEEPRKDEGEEGEL